MITETSTTFRAGLWRAFRKAGIAALRRFNPGDISIRHHYTGDRIKLHSFMHKGYWFYGKRREQETMELFAQLIRPGDSVVEVGGHIGYITLHFSRLVGQNGKVRVFEPGPNNLPYIRANIAGKANVNLISRAVADFCGPAQFFVENYTGQNNSLLSDYKRFDENLLNAGLEVSKSVIEVECVTLDAALENEPDRAPSFIKIDVEGAELTVLKGMSRTLRDAPVALMVEVTDRAQDVFDLLSGAGFIAFRGRGRPATSAAELQENTFWLKPNDARCALFANAAHAAGSTS